MTQRQTDSDLASQRAAADRLARLWRCEFHSLGEYSPVDYFATRNGKLLAFAEIKGARYCYGSYSGAMLTMRKYIALWFAHVSFGVDTFYVVQWTDALGYVSIASVDARQYSVNGRRDRGAVHDIEPIIRVPYERFKLIRE